MVLKGDQLELDLFPIIFTPGQRVQCPDGQGRVYYVFPDKKLMFVEINCCARLWSFEECQFLNA